MSHSSTTGTIASKGKALDLVTEYSKSYSTSQSRIPCQFAPTYSLYEMNIVQEIYKRDYKKLYNMVHTHTEAKRKKRFGDQLTDKATGRAMSPPGPSKTQKGICKKFL